MSYGLSNSTNQSLEGIGTVQHNINALEWPWRSLFCLKPF